MPRESKAQKNTVGRVMHEFKHGELESGSGRKVRNPRQAIAIALSEAGASNRQSPAQNRRDRARTARKERTGQTAQAEKEGAARPTRGALYAEARRRGIAGRSKMSKDELERALRRH